MTKRELISNVNPDIIQWSCDDIGISLDTLSDACKIKVNSLQTGQLSFPQLKRLGTYFKTGVLFFLSPKVPDINTYRSAQCRSLSSQPLAQNRNIKQLIKTVEHHRDIYLDLLEELDQTDHCQLHEFTKSVQSTSSNYASLVRDWLGITDSNNLSFDFYRSQIESKGICVYLSQGYSGQWKVENEKILGFSMPHEQAPIIFVTKTTPAKQTFTLFHELSHLLLHNDSHIDDHNTFSEWDAKQPSMIKVKEHEANLLAAQILCPDTNEAVEKIQNLDPNYYSPTSKSLAKNYGISFEAVIRRLEHNGKISRDQLTNFLTNQDTFVAEKNQTEAKLKPGRPFRHIEPLHIFGKPYVLTVLESLDNKHTTLSKASNYLDRIKISDVEKLKNYVFHKSFNHNLRLERAPS